MKYHVQVELLAAWPVQGFRADLVVRFQSQLVAINVNGPERRLVQSGLPFFPHQGMYEDDQHGKTEDPAKMAFGLVFDLSAQVSVALCTQVMPQFCQSCDSFEASMLALKSL